MKRIGLLFLALAAFALGAAIDFTELPEDGIYDPAGMLGSEYRETIAKRIQHEKLNENAELFLVLFPEEPREGARALAKFVGGKWAGSQYWAVIYQVGFEGEPAVVTGGSLMSRLNTNLVEQRIQAAVKGALTVKGRQGRLEEMTNILSNGLGYLRLVAAKMEAEHLGQIRTKAVQRQERKKKALLFAGVAMLALLAVSLLGYAFFLKRSKKSRSKKVVMFPETKPRLRLAGPYTGGSTVLVRFGSGGHS